MYNSKTHKDSRIRFRATGNSEQETKKNNGFPTNVAFLNGIATIDRDVSALLQYNLILNGTYSFRIKFKINEFQTSNSDPYLYDFRSNGGTGFALIDENDTRQITKSSGTIYQNGQTSSSALELNAWYDLIITGATFVNTSLYSIGSWSGDINVQRVDWDIELIEIFEGTLTANEVELLYENSLYIEPVFTNEISSVTPLLGIIPASDKYGNTITNTAVVPESEGGYYVEKYNGSTSRVGLGAFNTLVGDITVMAWIKVFGVGGGNQGRIIDNSKFWIRLASNLSIQVTSDASTTVGSAAGVAAIGCWCFVVVTRTSAGIINIYVNGVLSGSANQNSGTPVSGTSVYFGNNAAPNRGFNGLMGKKNIIQDIVTTKKIEQSFHSTKHIYGL